MLSTLIVKLSQKGIIGWKRLLFTLTYLIAILFCTEQIIPMRGHVPLTLRLQMRHQHFGGGSALLSVPRLTLLLVGVWESDTVGGENKYGDIYLDM